jgi:hypothetical protein
MGRSSCLIKMHTRTGHDYFVVPGGPVTDATAQEIIAMPHVMPGNDGLFPNHDQTWSIRKGDSRE